MWKVYSPIECVENAEGMLGAFSTGLLWNFSLSLSSTYKRRLHIISIMTKAML